MRGRSFASCSSDCGFEAAGIRELERIGDQKDAEERYALADEYINVYVNGKLVKQIKNSYYSNRESGEDLRELVLYHWFTGTKRGKGFSTALGTAYPEFWGKHWIDNSETLISPENRKVGWYTPPHWGLQDKAAGYVERVTGKRLWALLESLGVEPCALKVYSYKLSNDWYFIRMSYGAVTCSCRISPDYWRDESDDY